MIKLDDIELRRGDKCLLKNASANLHPGEKIALIGNNGTGKSSLLGLLQGRLATDHGEVRVPADWRIAWMRQEVEHSERPALEYVLDGDKALRLVQQQIQRAEQDENHQALAKLHEQLDSIDGYGAKNRAEQLLLGLGFQVHQLDNAVNHFSGGWQIRLNLAQALIQRSDLLLLDEPTNHLDLDAEIWLEQWLQQYDGTLLLISHDRDFIDNVCDGIWQIEHESLHCYRGNYSAFERQRAERLSQQQAAYQKQQQRIQDIERFVSRFRAKASKAKQAQSRLKELDRMALIAPAHIDSPFTFSFADAGKMSDPLLTLSDAQLGYAGQPLLAAVNLSIHPGQRIGLLGHNGAGKSTLIKSLCGDLPLISGERVGGEHLAIGYFSQHQMDALDLEASALLHLQRLSPAASEQAMRNFLGSFNFHGDQALAPVSLFSGGEKARLALALIVWQRPNLLLLDEPTNHLDLAMCHALTMALQDFAGGMMLISHDRHLLNSTVDQFYLVAEGRCDSFDGDLERYRQYLLQGNKQPASNADTTHDKRQKRQLAAQQRQRLAPLKQQLKQTERALSQAEQALQTVEAELADSAIYLEQNKEKLQDCLQRQAALKKQLNTLENDWLELEAELEQLQQQA